MTRRRLFVPGAIYHVYCRITRGEMVFANDGEPERLIDEMQRVKHHHSLTVFAFTVMGTHYHIGLRTASFPLWKTMLLLQSRFARDHNRRHGYLGPLWQSRYKARIVEDQSYFDQLLAYIHLNPVAAGLVDDPADYRWSGHSELLGLRKPMLIDIDETLSSFGSTRGEAREQYLSRVRLCAEAMWIKRGVRSLPWWSTVKDDEDLVAPRHGRSYWDYEGNRISIERPKIPSEQLLEIFCDHLMLEASDLKSRSRGPGVAQARALFAAIAIERYGKSVTEVAKLLGKNPGSVSRWLAQSRAGQDNPEVRSQLDYLDDQIRTKHAEPVRQ